MKTCFSKICFLLTWFIVGFVVFAIYLYSGAFEYSTNSAFCRQSAASYMKKQYSKVLKLAAVDKFNLCKSSSHLVHQY